MNFAKVLRWPTSIGDNRFNDRLTDYSPAAFKRRDDHDRAALAEFKSIGSDGLTAEDKLNLALMLQKLDVAVAGARFKTWEMPVNQVNGPPLGYAGLARDMPFKTQADFENYLKRLRALPLAFDQLTTDMQLGMRDGLMPPRYLLQKVAPEMDDVAKKPLQESLFTDPLKHFPGDITAPQQQRLTAEINHAVTAIVQPAYTKFSIFVAQQYAPKGRTDFGIWSLPDGAERYRQNIHEQTTTDMSPADLHALGLKQVAQIDAEMLAIAKAQGFNDVKSFNQHIHADRALYGTSGPQILSLYQKYTDQMYAKLPLYFGRLPKNKLVVTPMEDYRAPNGYPADYSEGAGDGSRPGRINVNEYNPQGTPSPECRSHRLSRRHSRPSPADLHCPGNSPAFLPFAVSAVTIPTSKAGRSIPKHSPTKWASIRDPYSEYGRLQNLMWRSIRLVVDTGVHSQHWSRQQMIDFFHAHTAMDDQNINTEVDRYIAWPGQALGYKLGEMTILRLRADARDKLKTKFDIRAFHDAVLDGGPMPLSVLEKKVEDWIASQ